MSAARTVVTEQLRLPVDLYISRYEYRLRLGFHAGFPDSAQHL